MTKDKIENTADAMEAAAMPNARVAHSRPGAPTAEQTPLPKGVTAKPQEQKSPAEWAYERIILYIKNFEEQLNSDEEVGMGMAGGDVGTIHIQGVGFFAPDLITFYGNDGSGARTQLVQHVSQLNVMLRAAPKQTETPTRIGFDLARQLEEG